MAVNSRLPSQGLRIEEPGWPGCDDFDGRTDTSACQSCPHHSLITWPWAHYSASPGLSCQFQSLSPVFCCSVYQQLWTWLIRPFLKYSLPSGRGHLSLLGPPQPSWPLFLSLLCLVLVFPITHRATPGSVFSPLCPLCAQPRRAITRLKPNPPSLPTGSSLESSVWKWQHQFSQLFKPDSLESSSAYFSLLYLIQQRILLLLLLKSILLSTLGVVTSVSHLDDCICSLTDASASALVLNSIFPTVARTIL